MIRLRLLSLPFLLLGLITPLAAQDIGITGGFPWTADPSDTTASPLMPTLPAGVAGAHGFVESNDEGNLRFGDGTPVRFVGVTISGSACFPDSAAAIAEARRLRVLGVNLVRFRYMDFSYDWAGGLSILNPADGFRSLEPAQTRRFDWFVHQLKENGIYTGLTLQSARVPRLEDGIPAYVLDSLPWIAQGMNYLYPQARAAHKHVARQLLDHVNPFTGTAYKAEPAIATVELMHGQGMNTIHRLNWDSYEPFAYYSWKHTRRVDTLYNDWLRAKYGTTAALAAAWNETPPQGGYPNLLTEGSFEGEFDRYWTFGQGNGLSVLPLLEQDSVPHGAAALTLRVRDALGNVGDAYMWQPVELEYNTIYRFSFKAKGSNPEGRTLTAVIGAAQGGLNPGFNQSATVLPYWSTHEMFFLVPVENTVPTYLYLFFGDKEGELTIDDVRLEEYQPTGLTAAERLETSTVARDRWGARPVLSGARHADQYGFYHDLESEYVGDLTRFVRDTIGSGALIVGTQQIWASTLLDAAAQSATDLSMSSQGWDYISGEGGTWHIRNYSQIRQGVYGPTYYHPMFALEGKPMIVSFASPFPNRFLNESFLMNPSYMLLQDYDGIIFDTWDEDRLDNRPDIIDSADWNGMRNNPVTSALMPAISQIVRNGLIAPARTTIRLQHTAGQLLQLPRLAGSWGAYGVPGGINGAIPAISRVVTDSLDATEFTQANDFAVPAQAEGELMSDTRELRWEVARGIFNVNTPFVQGASGHLNRPGGIQLDNLEITPFSTNETATVLWVPLDPEVELAAPGRSLLTIVTRSEPTEWMWNPADSTTGVQWGHGPMLMEPTRMQLEFAPTLAVDAVTITPLDQRGEPIGEPIAATKTGANYRITIDQSTMNAVWFSVDFFSDGLDVAPEEIAAAAGVRMRLLPNIVDEHGTIGLRADTPQQIVVTLRDGLGRACGTLYSGTIGAAEERIDFDAMGLPVGSYMVEVTTEEGGRVVAPLRIVR